MGVHYCGGSDRTCVPLPALVAPPNTSTPARVGSSGSGARHAWWPYRGGGARPIVLGMYVLRGDPMNRGLYERPYTRPYYPAVLVTQGA
jgi:hypothetical protein